jgi:hypothetical protein
MGKYYKGDDFNAFGQEWALVEVDIPEDWIVSKAELKIGNLPKMTFLNPVFPLPVNLESYQTVNLKDINTCYVAIYDEEGRKLTLDGSWTFVAEEERV